MENQIEITLKDELEKANVLSRDTHGKGWDSAGHLAIGNDAFKEFYKKLPDELKAELEKIKFIDNSDNNKIKIKLPTISDDGAPNYENNCFVLSPGDIVALAGDFYAVPNEPICFGHNKEERARRFINAYKKLANEANLSDIEWLVVQLHSDIEKSIKENKEEKKTIAKRLLSIFKPVKELLENIKFTIHFVDDAFPCAFWHSLYFNLLLTNFDHFGDEAEKAYLTGHKLALHEARLGYEATNIETKYKHLILALSYELYACHFLTDLFAAGHIRTPRKQIVNYLSGRDPDAPLHGLASDIPSSARVIGSALALKMHNEDGNFGLEVKNDLQSEPWVAFGDGHYFETQNADDVKRMMEAMEACLNDIYKAYSEKDFDIKANAKNYSKYLPKEADKNTPPFPLYRTNPENSKDMQMRMSSLAEEKCAFTIADTNQKFISFLRESHNDTSYNEIFPDMPDQIYALLEKELYYIKKSSGVTKTISIDENQLNSIKSRFGHLLKDKKFIDLNLDDLKFITKITGHHRYEYDSITGAGLLRFFNFSKKNVSDKSLNVIPNEEIENILKQEIPRFGK